MIAQRAKDMRFQSRSPVILDEGQVKDWLNPDLTDVRVIAGAFQAHGSDAFEVEQEPWGKAKAQGELF